MVISRTYRRKKSTFDFLPGEAGFRTIISDDEDEVEGSGDTAAGAEADAAYKWSMVEHWRNVKRQREEQVEARREDERRDAEEAERTRSEERERRRREEEEQNNHQWGEEQVEFQQQLMSGRDAPAPSFESTFVLAQQVTLFAFIAIGFGLGFWMAGKDNWSLLGRILGGAFVAAILGFAGVFASYIVAGVIAIGRDAPWLLAVLAALVFAVWVVFFRR